MDSGYSSLARWCSQEAAAARRAVIIQGATGGVDYASVRPELVRRLAALDAALAAAVELPGLYANPEWAAVKLDGWAALLAPMAPAAVPASPGPKRRRATKPGKVCPLTGCQAETVQIVGECKGDIAAAARRLGKNRKTVEESYKVGLTKLGKAAVKHKTHLFARDRRGQADVTDGDDLRKR